MKRSASTAQPDQPASTGPIASSVYRLADSMVLIGVVQTDRGPEPLFTDVSGALTAVAYTDADEMHQVLPDGYHRYQIQVSELLAQLPEHVGLVVDPHTASPVYVPGDQRQSVIDAAWPFPTGAHVRYGVPSTEPTDLLACIAAKSARLPTVLRWWRAWYQVQDAREKLLLVYQVDGDGEELTANAGPAANAAYDCLALATYDHPAQVICLVDVPDDARAWLQAEVPPFYQR